MNTDPPTDQATAPTAAADPGAVPQYEIRVAGRLERRWATWFDGFNLAAGADGSTVISGPVVDQAALHGLLQRLRDMGIPLVSLTSLTPDPCPTNQTGATS